MESQSVFQAEIQAKFFLLNRPPGGRDLLRRHVGALLQEAEGEGGEDAAEQGEVAGAADGREGDDRGGAGEPDGASGPLRGGHQHDEHFGQVGGLGSDRLARHVFGSDTFSKYIRIRCNACSGLHSIVVFALVCNVTCPSGITKRMPRES